MKGGHKYKIYFPSDWLPTAPWAAPVLEVGKLGSFPGPCLLWTTIDGDQCGGLPHSMNPDNSKCKPLLLCARNVLSKFMPRNKPPHRSPPTVQTKPASDIHPCMVVISGNGIVVLSRNNMAVICGVFKGILLGHYMAV